MTHPIRPTDHRDVLVPRELLERSGLRGDVSVTVEDGRIVIESAARPHPQAGWEKSFANANPADDPEDPIHDPPTPTRFDDEDWTWPEDAPAPR